jgi:acetyl esterase/lipase
MHTHNAALTRVIQLMQDVDSGSTIEQARVAMEDFAARQLPPPADTVIEPIVAGGVPAEWVWRAGTSGEPVTLYLHGGGYLVGSPRTHRELGARLAGAAGGRVLLLDYRLAPEPVCPAALEDAVAAYRWLLDEGVDARQIVMAGDSAGGGLALATLAAARDAGLPLPAAGVCLCPWTDLALTGASLTTRAALDPFLARDGLTQAAALCLGDLDPRDPRASPLYGDLSGLPPLLVQAGGADILHDDATRLAERACAAGVDVTLDVWDEMPHCWQGFAAVLPEGEQAVQQIGVFIRERTDTRRLSAS